MEPESRLGSGVFKSILVLSVSFILYVIVSDFTNKSIGLFKFSFRVNSLIGNNGFIEFSSNVILLNKLLIKPAILSNEKNNW